jgi:hypothetical protein
MKLLRGGDDVGPLTLTRFFALHAVALPFATLAAVSVHLFLIRRYGISPAKTRVGETPAYAGPFYPAQFVRDSTAIVLTGIVCLALARFVGAPLEAKADPNVTAYVPSPDWYFLGLQCSCACSPGGRRSWDSRPDARLLFPSRSYPTARPGAPARRPVAIVVGRSGRSRSSV